MLLSVAGAAFDYKITSPREVRCRCTAAMSRVRYTYARRYCYADVTAASPRQVCRFDVYAQACEDARRYAIR